MRRPNGHRWIGAVGGQLRAIEFDCLDLSLLSHGVIQLNASEPVIIFIRFAADDIEKHGLYITDCP